MYLDSIKSMLAKDATMRPTAFGVSDRIQSCFKSYTGGELLDTCSKCDPVSWANDGSESVGTLPNVEEKSATTTASAEKDSPTVLLRLVRMMQRVSLQ